MTNKTVTMSREQFESVNPVPFGVFWSGPDSRYMTSMVHLNCLEYQGKWSGWQSAMLTAPVVERQEPISDWATDTSAGRPILTFKKCSVIEAEDAEYILGLVRRDRERQEPVAWGTMQKGWPDDQRTLITEKAEADHYNDHCYELTPLFTLPVAVAVVLPNPRVIFDKDFDEEDRSYSSGWNACLDKVKELNQ